MTETNGGERERRRFERHDLTGEARALDAQGNELGRVEKVGAGGMQIRLANASSGSDYQLGQQLDVSIVEPGNIRNQFKVKVRVRDGSLLGVEFLY